MAEWSWRARHCECGSLEGGGCGGEPPGGQAAGSHATAARGGLRTGVGTRRVASCGSATTTTRTTSAGHRAIATTGAFANAADALCSHSTAAFANASIVVYVFSGSTALCVFSGASAPCKQSFGTSRTSRPATIAVSSTKQYYAAATAAAARADPNRTASAGHAGAAAEHLVDTSAAAERIRDTSAAAERREPVGTAPRDLTPASNAQWHSDATAAWLLHHAASTALSSPGASAAARPNTATAPAGATTHWLAACAAAATFINRKGDYPSGSFTAAIWNGAHCATRRQQLAAPRRQPGHHSARRWPAAPRRLLAS